MEEATEGNKIRISEEKLRNLLKTSLSHVKKVIKRDKLVCGCHHCILFEDIFNCYLRWRKTFAERWEAKVSTMSGSGKRRELGKLKRYLDFVFEDGDRKKPITVREAWDAAAKIGCDPVTIGDRSYPRFACLLNSCDGCAGKYKDLLPEAELQCDETISYVIWGQHHKCSYHSDMSMGARGKEGKEHYCKECESLTEKRRAGLKGGEPSMKSIKTRVMQVEKTVF